MQHTDQDTIQRLEAKSRDIRKLVIRYIEGTGVGHVGGALSMVEIAVALYYHYMRFDPANLKWPERDRFILSKGHCCDTLAAIFIDMGLYDFDHAMATFEKGKDSVFSMHPSRKFVPAYEASTGSLGHGLPIALGIALGERQYKTGFRTFCVVGDGEFDEGSNWEAIMAAAHYRLGNLVCILDKNQFQMTGATCDTLDHGDVAAKLRAFGWETYECDGNSIASLCSVLDQLPPLTPGQEGKPVFIVANTLKGKGVDYMEGQCGWHGGGLTHEQADRAVACIEKGGDR